jgi:hypothetical protein
LPIQTTAAPGSVNSNGLNITGVTAAVTGGIATALNSFPTVNIGSQISGVFSNANGLLQGADLNKVVDVAKNAGNTLTASVSELIPIDSWQASLNAVNEKTKSLASAETAKTLQEQVGKATSFFTGPNAQNAVTAFQNGSNQLVQSVGALDKTPFKNLQFEAGSQLSNLLGSNSLSAPSATRYTGNMTTNPSQST